MSNYSPAEELFFEGNRRMKAEDNVGAEACFRQALLLVADFGEASANLGFLRSKAGDFSEAEAYFRQAILTRPAMEEAYLMLGVLLMNQKRFAESEQLYLSYLQQFQASAPAWSNYGVLLACLQREQEAEQCYRKALSLDAQYKQASFNLSYILLRQERWEEGFRCLEDRWSYVDLDRHFTCPRWHGESLSGKAVMIGFEAGHGDMIFYARYIAVLKQRGVRQIGLICHPALVKLFATLDGVDQLFSFQDDVPGSGWDFWTPPMSLPYYCQTRAPDFPAPIPYLYALPEKISLWRERIPATGFNVGLVWRGSALFENDADRSIPSLDVLRPLGAVKGINFISLQKGMGEQEALSASDGLPLCALGHQLADFSDTAAVLSSLDLVISVDTAVAHLAGAMGVPCWVLLPYYRADWRWLKERTDSVWYPQTMRLFRQSCMSDWSDVVVEVVYALQQQQINLIQEKSD